MKVVQSFVLLSLTICFLSSCATGPEDPLSKADSNIFVPSYDGLLMETLELSADTSEYSPIRKYAAMEIPENNPITLEKSALGRQLFWDERISGDGVRSCYYCHQCETGLADDKPKAIGAFEKTLTRNSPTLWNIGYHAQFYWDGRSPSLEAQVLAAWRGGNMGADTEEIVKRLNAIRGYKDQFKEVFNEDATSENVAKALATYMRLFISDTTPWDRWQEGNESAVNAAAKRGYKLFKRAGCDNCHDGVLFTDLQYHNVGIGMDIEEPDLGRFTVTQNDKDRGAFKTPTLRDIRQSAPYFHDGSVATLEEAVDIMLGGGKDNSYLDRTNLKKFKLSSSEKQDLIEFLLSLEQPCGLYEPLLPPED